MAQRDIYHNTVKHALQQDGWIITHDPFPLQIGDKNLAIDLGAERLISAEKGSQKIVVEIKSFIGQSDVRDLQQALGQYLMYQRILQKQMIERQLYLAITKRTFATVFTIELGRLFLEDHFVRLIVFDDESERIVQWID